jgi:GNAT superfamily N-acetyltransferase
MVRRAQREDFPTLFGLIEALADFEQLDPPDEAARERLQRDGWPEGAGSPRFSAWLAEQVDTSTQQNKAVGYAITFFTYSSFLARPTLYIEDIFVLPDARRQSVGSALMERLIEEAKTTGCGRIEWVVLDWNTGAQQFYQRLGASHLTDWQYYRLLLEQ